MSSILAAERFPIERFDEIANHPGDFRLLERIPITVPEATQPSRLPVVLTATQSDDHVKQLVMLDTETTGVSPFTDQIIELGMVRASYSANRGVLLSIDRIYDELEAPERPIPSAITKLTGITDEMVSGKRLDEDGVLSFMNGKPLVLAHNAGFDRPFFERRFPHLKDLFWACTQQEVDWNALGAPSRKQEVLALSRGWFYDAHRASTDCLAMLWLLHVVPGALKMLLESARQPSIKLIVRGNSFDVKDQLKEKGARFEQIGNDKYWYLMVGSDREAEELTSYVQRLNPMLRVDRVMFTARNRYKSK
ncbi:MAG: DNA polymerase III subunit epsilon [Succinivibrio sp.]|nr:DNA polymerase III subunit epsilon [Succinivibrio sp.]